MQYLKKTIELNITRTSTNLHVLDQLVAYKFLEEFTGDTVPKAQVASGIMSVVSNEEDVRRFQHLLQDDPSLSNPISIFPILGECTSEGVLVLDNSSVATGYSDYQYFGPSRDSYGRWQTNGRMASRRGEAYLDTHGREKVGEALASNGR